MRTGLQRLSTFSAAALAVVLGADAGAVRIDGIGMVASAAETTPTVRAGRLDAQLSEQQVLTITPWPAFLPQRFGRQQVATERQLHPAGPVDRIAFTRSGESAPWLQIVRGSRRASPVVGDWRLQQSTQGWTISNGSTAYWLGNGTHPVRPVSLVTGGERWCIYLLESRLPQTVSRELAGEMESQADWAAVRQRRNSKQCG